MAAYAIETDVSPPLPMTSKPFEVLVRARIAAGGVTRAELYRDLTPLAEGLLDGTALRVRVDLILAALAGQGHAVEEGRGRWRLNEASQAEVAALLGNDNGHVGDWATVKATRLVGLALDLGRLSAQKARALGRPDGLRAAILQRAFNLPKRPTVSSAKLRAQLAVVALQRAFGNKIRDGLGAGEGLSPKAGRLLAGQLCQAPRDFGTDKRLVAQLAAEVVGAARPDADALRLAVLRGWLARGAGIDQKSATEPAAKVKPLAPPVAPRPPAASRPDLLGFAAAVQSAAKKRQRGWPGNYKAFISDVWDTLAKAHPEWGLTEIEFKGMLAEAHRTGHVRLANADLKDRTVLTEVQRSAISYKNTIWHLVRIDD